MPFEIWNRRYTGSKFKLADWICDIINNNCVGSSFCDLFAGTGIISQRLLSKYDVIILNDFLYSNEIIYKAFFEQTPYDINALSNYSQGFQSIDPSACLSNYIVDNFGGKFFSNRDALLIGEIRNRIENLSVNQKERCILLASLLYSADKAANTVGHYDAYIKNHFIPDEFHFDLISPYSTTSKIQIYREDANTLVQHLDCDIVYIDPPYNSRQYSRFYHVLENITKWERPQLYGEALKPKPENMSEYCKSNAVNAFSRLIQDLKCKYILVSYNNTYESKSSSSKNKMSLENINIILSVKGKVTRFETPHQFFNAGKTDFADHKEFLFLVEVTQND